MTFETVEGTARSELKAGPISLIAGTRMGPLTTPAETGATTTGVGIWCQLPVLEPSAAGRIWPPWPHDQRGSETGGGWVVNGQKMWTSLGHRAAVGLLLESGPKNTIRYSTNVSLTRVA
jgi:hypothetical protein